jgi:hypothetical protein
MNVHPHFIFQALVIGAVVLILVQMKFADALDQMRHPDRGWWFQLRRYTTFFVAATLCWAVEYAWENGWVPWPPFMAFMAAFDCYVLANIFIMRSDLISRRGRSLI